MESGDPFLLPEQLLLAGDEQADVGRAAVHRLHDGGCHNHRRLRDQRRVPPDQGEGVVLARPEPEFGAQTPEGDAGDPGRGGAPEPDRVRIARVAILTHEAAPRPEQDEG